MQDEASTAPISDAKPATSDSVDADTPAVLDSGLATSFDTSDIPNTRAEASDPGCEASVSADTTVKVSEEGCEASTSTTVAEAASEEVSSVLTAESVSKFVQLSADGLLNHYEPTFKNIQKDLGKSMEITE